MNFLTRELSSACLWYAGPTPETNKILILIRTSVDIGYSGGVNNAAYGWEAITKISDPNQMRNNADSFAFYVTGVFTFRSRFSFKLFWGSMGS